MLTEIFSKYMFFGLIGLAVFFEVVGDVYFKKWSLENRSILLFFGLMIYFVGSAFWAISLKYGYLSRAITVFTILNLIVVVMTGVILFKEDLSLVNKIGIGLGILSIILMEL